jgi:hypothetical protein
MCLATAWCDRTTPKDDDGAKAPTVRPHKRTRSRDGERRVILNCVALIKERGPVVVKVVLGCFFFATPTIEDEGERNKDR